MDEAASYTVLLGRKPLKVSPPVVLKREVLTDTIEVDPYFRQPGDPEYIDVVTSDCYQIFSGTQLIAISNRFTLKKDLKTGHMTLRLFKNRTTLYA